MNPIANTLVSDVRGPTDTLYLNGARLEEMQLIGMLPPGNLANITVFSYAGQLFFALLAAETLPTSLKISNGSIARGRIV
jgi:hypothetical protein